MFDKSSLGYEIKINEPFDQAIETVTAELKKEGFGILTRIDVHKTLKEKIGEDFRPYAILGACNPPLAFKALSSDPETGLLLPCNVTIEASPSGGSVIRVVNPLTMMMVSQSNNPAVENVAQQASERLLRVAQSLGERVTK